MMSTRFFPAIALVSALAGEAATVPACTPAERQDAAVALGVISTVASSPVPCLITKVAASGSSATLCGTVSSDVSEVTKIVEDVLAALPPAPAGMRAEESAPVRVDVRGKAGSIVTVTLAPVAAEALQKKLKELATAGAASAGKDGGA